MHKSNWGEHHNIDKNILFTKYAHKVEEISINQQFDLVFFDAFAPNKQAEVWEIDVLKRVYDHMRVGGVLVTYCAKGQFKRDLVALGFDLETLDGPPGKKEMVRATK